MDIWQHLVGLIRAEDWNLAAATALRIILILAATWLGMRLVRKAVALLGARLAPGRGAEETKRLDTLMVVLRYVANVAILVTSFLLVLSALGLSIAPLLATAGVATLAISLGAQSLVKDFFNGFFLLMEDHIRVGDVVEIAGKSGLVEEVTLRYIRLRDYEGNVHFVPNGAITTVTNRSVGFAYSVIDLRLVYEQDVEAAIATLRQVGEELRADPAFSERILEPLEVAGVDALGESALTLRCRFKVVPLAQWEVRREFHKRVNRAMREQGVEVPYPHLRVASGAGGESLG